jgi:hypothetical protein
MKHQTLARGEPAARQATHKESSDFLLSITEAFPTAILILALP